MAKKINKLIHRPLSGAYRIKRISTDNASDSRHGVNRAVRINVVSASV
jgi:hypothetical protein